jgi:Ran GTPase-activating protein 1
MSGNSYGTEACQWIAENVIKFCENIKKVDFSDIFTSRLRSDLPNSLLLLMTALEGKSVQNLDLSHNAFGPDGVKSFQDFLVKNSSLKVLNITNCGLGPIGGKMVAEAMEQNKNMKLVEFYASRDRLEQEGLQALSGVFQAQ